jgi:hypothetical protein
MVEVCTVAKLQKMWIVVAMQKKNKKVGSMLSAVVRAMCYTVRSSSGSRNVVEILLK